METKMIKIPFEVELAKKISNGEVKGRIVTRDGRSVRIVCWDTKDPAYPIIALVDDGVEMYEPYMEDGRWIYKGNEVLDLMLEVPEEKPKCEFKPFDRVLVRSLYFNSKIWYNDIFSFRDKDGKYMCIGNKWDECIPYNEETAHLLGTTDNFEDNK